MTDKPIIALLVRFCKKPGSPHLVGHGLFPPPGGTPPPRLGQGHNI